jgi:hypothetical protein
VCAGCIPGDKRWQPGEEAAVASSSALGGTIKLNPDIKAPYSHEASVFFERQLNDTTGIRAGFVYKTEDDLITNNYQINRGLDAYTVPFTFVDIGVDGLRGTADDKNLTLLGFPNANAAAFPVDQYVTNLDQFGRYKTIEVSTNKRYGNKWSATLGGGYTWTTNFPNNTGGLNGFPQNPNQPGVEDRTGWGIKATGSYDAPHGIRISPIVRHQSGVNYAREYTITVPAGSGLSVSGTTAYADKASDNREDNILVFDVRVEKQFLLGPRLKFRGYMDFFNLSNSHASETIGRATGTSYQKPALILAPRTARLGFRVLF